MAYEIPVRPVALWALKRIDRQDQVPIALLAADPRPPGIKAPRGRDGFRVSAGGYCIIYKVEGDRLLIVVVTLGHRRGVCGH